LAERDNLVLVFNIDALQFDDQLACNGVCFSVLMIIYRPLQSDDVLLKTLFNGIDNHLVNQSVERPQPGDCCDGDELG